MASIEIKETFKCTSGVKDTVTVIYYDHPDGHYDGPGTYKDGLWLACESENDGEYYTVYMDDQQVEDMATALNYYLHRREVNKKWEAEH